MVVSIFAWIIFSLATNSISSLDFSFFYLNPEDSGRSGGVFSILISSSLILGIAVLCTIPLGLLCAIFLTEWSNEKEGFATILRQSLEILSGVPSIVFGLFGSAFFCVYLGLGYSILAGGLTLSCMILPLFIRVVEEGLSAIPKELHDSSDALALSKCGKITHIILPSALPTITIAIVLSIARSLSETAALLFTSGYVLRTPESLLDSGRTLSVHIFDLAMNVPGGETSAYKSAFILVLLLCMINAATSLVARSLQKRKQAIF